MNVKLFFIYPSMNIGDANENVIILQSKLKDLGYFFSSITGIFDSYTEDVVKKFQNNNGLISNGTTNFETWKTLFSPTTDVNNLMTIDTKPVLRLGSTGPYVTELQEVLTKLIYYTSSIDGNFGTETENAVKRFQINNKLTADGVVGRDTWSALYSLYSPLAICDEEPDQEYFLYTVVAGDTLWSIARRFGTTVEEIKRLNSLTSDLLRVGEILKIPNVTNEETYFLYTVVAGDTFFMRNNEKKYCFI